jgi:hypothetical protein
VTLSRCSLPNDASRQTPEKVRLQRSMARILYEEDKAGNIRKV